MNRSNLKTCIVIIQIMLLAIQMITGNGFLVIPILLLMLLQFAV